jgi:hypothetical protein
MIEGMAAPGPIDLDALDNFYLMSDHAPDDQHGFVKP